MDEVLELVVVIPTSPISSKRSQDEKVITVFVLQFLQARISAKDFCARQPDGG
jgi:hypothetical protein